MDSFKTILLKIIWDLKEIYRRGLHWGNKPGTEIQVSEVLRHFTKVNEWLSWALVLAEYKPDY